MHQLSIMPLRVHSQPLPKFSEESLAMTISPNRSCVQSELERHCFFLSWLIRCATKKDTLSKILRAYGIDGQPTQRDQIVAATLIVWLGSNLGGCFISSAKKLLGSGDKRLLPQACVLHWQEENKERGFVRGPSDYHVLRWVMNERTEEELRGYGHPRIHSAALKHALSPISKRDIAISNALMQWLGTKDGQAFNASVERLIQRYQKEQVMDYHRIWNLGILAPVA